MKGYIEMAIRKRIIKRGVGEEVLAALDADIAEYIEARNKAQDFEEKRKEIGGRILSTLKDNDLDTYEGKFGKATAVQQYETVVDPMKLKKRIGVTLWNRVTDRRINKAKLDAYIKSKDIKASDVVACSTETPRTPFVNVTAK